MFFYQHCVSWTVDTQYSFLVRVTVDKYTLSRLINLLLNERKVVGLFPTHFLFRNNLVKVADSRSRSLNIINVIISGWIPPRKRVSGYGLSKKKWFHHVEFGKTSSTARSLVAIQNRVTPSTLTQQLWDKYTIISLKILMKFHYLISQVKSISSVYFCIHCDFCPFYCIFEKSQRSIIRI